MKNRALVVDDEQFIREILVMHLNEMGYKYVDSVCCGLAARCLAGMNYSLAILDVAMPGCGGVAAASEIKCINADTKILLISGHAYGQSDVGFPILAKPFSSDDLEKAIGAL